MIAALLVSPAAGRGVAARIAGTVAQRLRGAVDRLDTLVAGSAAGSAAMARDAVAAGVDVLVVLGGDGLAHTAVQACAGSPTALAVIPAGTGNDLARALAAPADPLAATLLTADALRTGHTRAIDLGRVSGGSWFATVLCAGFDSAVERTGQHAALAQRSTPLRPGDPRRNGAPQAKTACGGDRGHHAAAGRDHGLGRQFALLRRRHPDLPGLPSSTTACST